MSGFPSASLPVESPPAPDAVGPAERRSLAALHRECLPDSAVAGLGERYAESFYRYVGASTREHVFLHCNPRGGIDAACVVSLDPTSLHRRLWCSTPLIRSVMRGSRAATRRSLAIALSPFPRAQHFVNDSGEPLLLDAPEIILLFVAADRRRRGLGCALLDRARAWLRINGFHRCSVRTRDDPRNRAVDFYRAAGFEFRGRSPRRDFQVWESAV